MSKQKQSLRTAVPLHTKQAQRGDNGTTRPLFFAERAQCHKEHQVLIEYKVFHRSKSEDSYS